MSRLSEAAAAIATRLAYWSHDETSGTNIDDSESTNDLTVVGGTVGGASLVPSNPNGKSVSLDGVNDYESVPLPAAYKVGRLDVMFVLNVPAAWPAAGGYFITFEPRGAFSGKGLLIGYQDSANRKIFVQKGIGGSFITLVSGSALAAGTSYLIFVRSGGNDGTIVWIRTITTEPPVTSIPIDGSNANVTAIDWTDAAAGNFPDPAQMYIGGARSNAAASDNIVANQFMKGLVSDVALFDSTSTLLTDADRETLYKAACFARPPASAPTAGTGSYDITIARSVSWGASVGEAGHTTNYEVQYQRNRTGVWTAIGTTTSTSINFTAPLVGSYRFRVRAIINTVPSEWVEGTEDATFIRVVAGAAYTHTNVVAAHSPEEGYSLEETASEADFLKAVATGYDATGGNIDASSSAADFESRDEDGICNAVRTKAGGLTSNFLETKRPAAIGLFANAFAISMWIRPLGNSAKIGGPHLMLVRPIHANSSFITGESDADVETFGMYGLGISADRGRIGAHLYSHNYFPTAPVTFYDPPALLSTTDWHHIACVVGVRNVAGTDKLRIRLFFDGSYCGGISGSYTELDQIFGVFNQSLPGHTNADWFTWVASWPLLGSEFHATDLLGNRYNGYFDEPRFYAYEPGDAIWMQQYLAGRATIIATPVGAFTNPLGGEILAAGSVLNVAWGAAVPAPTGYLLEASYNGAAYAVVGTPATNSYAHTLPTSPYDVRYRVTPMYDGYTPEACKNASAISGEFSITAVVDESAERAWAFPLDGHVFYVLNFADEPALIYDLTTRQWSRWYRNIGDPYWNMFRGIVWKGRVIAADGGAAKIWELDPHSWLDEGVVQIKRIVTGVQPVRGKASARMGAFRVVARKHDAAQPATVKMRYSDNDGQSYSADRSVLLGASSYSQRLEFRSLGRVRAPGRIFEIEDTGGFVRIEGADADLEGEGNAS